MSRKTKKGKAKKKNAEKAFCSEVAKFAKDNKGILFPNKFCFRELKTDVEFAFRTIERFRTPLSGVSSENLYFRQGDSMVSFLKKGNKLLKLDLYRYGFAPSVGVKKISFVKPTLLFEEISYKEAKANNTIEFELVKWISETKRQTI